MCCYFRTMHHHFLLLRRAEGKKAPSPSLAGEPHGLSSPQLMSSHDSSLSKKRRPILENGPKTTNVCSSLSLKSYKNYSGQINAVPKGFHCLCNLKKYWYGTNRSQYKGMKSSFTKKKKQWKMNLSLSSQVPSGIVGRPGRLKWPLWRFCAVFFDTIHTSFLLSGLLHSLEKYSVMHFSTCCFQRCSSLSLICKDRWDTWRNSNKL